MAPPATTTRLPFLYPQLFRSLRGSSSSSSCSPSYSAEAASSVSAGASTATTTSSRPRHAFKHTPPSQAAARPAACQRRPQTPRPSRLSSRSRNSSPVANFGTAPRCVLNARPHGRYGTANEPLPSQYSGSVGGGKEGEARDGKEGKEGVVKDVKEGNVKEGDGKESPALKGKTQEAKTQEAEQSTDSKSKRTEPASPAEETGSADAGSRSEARGGGGDQPPKAASPTIFETEGSPAVPPKPMPASRLSSRAKQHGETESNPLEAVLRMPAPTGRPPHLTTPPYVHHFDTWSLVKQLETSGFSEDQSITIMKAVRGILADNLEVAREGLVGKSDVENETYLFRAACSELRTEVENNRKAENERMTSQRNQLHHEVDILTQRLDQESSNMADALKGMFDDRKMAVRMEQRAMESKIQELNYKITVALNSDARSEVEGLRWTITRRAVVAIVVVAASILATLNYSSYMTRTQDSERKKMAKSPASGSSSGGAAGAAGGEGEGAFGAEAEEGWHGGHGGSGGGGAGQGGVNSEAIMRALESEAAGDGVMVSEGGVSLG